MSPHAKHRKICNSVNEATFGSMKTSTIDIPQIGHGGAEGICGAAMFLIGTF
jgi:hypothetical protein